jgi:putative transposase
MAGWVLRWLSAVRTRLRQRLDLLLEFIVLRHQLAVLQRTGTRRPCFRPSERLFWVSLSRWWANWQRSLIIVQPATVLRWRRRSLWAIWLSGSSRRWRGGRPRISGEVRALIVRMSQENFLWGAPRIHGELLKLGLNVSQTTVSRYMCQGAVIRPPRPGAPSCGTRHLGSVRSVLAKQVGYQTSFLLSSATGSRELSASPRCGMASVAGLSSHR